MTVGSLPIVCGYCRMPLRYRRGHLVMTNGREHFYLGRHCLFVTEEQARFVDAQRRR